MRSLKPQCNQLSKSKTPQYLYKYKNARPNKKQSKSNKQQNQAEANNHKTNYNTTKKTQSTQNSKVHDHQINKTQHPSKTHKSPKAIAIQTQEQKTTQTTK